MEPILQWVVHYRYAGIFFLLMLGIVGLPVPDEGLLAFAGFLVLRGKLHMAPTLAAAFLGSACGITVSYVLGRTMGVFLLQKYGSLLHISRTRMEQAHQWFERQGAWALPIGYFVPGVRHVTAMLAGASRLSVPLFIVAAYSGALVWSSTFVMTGYLLGESWRRVGREIGHYQFRLSLIAAALAIAALIWFKRKQKASGQA